MCGRCKALGRKKCGCESRDLTPTERARAFLAELPEVEGTPDEAVAAANEDARRSMGWGEEFWRTLGGVVEGTGASLNGDLRRPCRACGARGCEHIG